MSTFKVIRIIEGRKRALQSRSLKDWISAWDLMEMGVTYMC